MSRAALLHGLGRTAVPAAVWERRAKLGAADWEAVRRAPYWTARAGAHIPGLEADALLASQAYERLDGSGYFRSLKPDALDQSQRLLAATVAWVALRSPRPWRAAHPHRAASAILEAQASSGRLDRDAAATVVAAPARVPVGTHGMLGAREIEVLQRFCRGESSREMGRALRITPGAVRTHVDRIVEALACQSRPAATLKALALGLL
jgi:HD-GYP domain-containing protein (c-di-GMP phosphodiesterase class II)